MHSPKLPIWLVIGVLWSSLFDYSCKADSGKWTKCSAEHKFILTDHVLDLYGYSKTADGQAIHATRTEIMYAGHPAATISFVGCANIKSSLLPGIRELEFYKFEHNKKIYPDILCSSKKELFQGFFQSKLVNTNIILFGIMDVCAKGFPDISDSSHDILSISFWMTAN
jgi:hypothetical protein